MENEVRGSFQTKFFYLNKEVKKNQKSPKCVNKAKSPISSLHTRENFKGGKNKRNPEVIMVGPKVAFHREGPPADPQRIIIIIIIIIKAIAGYF
jgi:hypothetical protein